MNKNKKIAIGLWILGGIESILVGLIGKQMPFGLVIIAVGFIWWNM